MSQEQTKPLMRDFQSGATRSSDEGKHDYEGFLSPLVVERFAEYMTTHRKQADGKLRDSDNWQKGIPKSAYMKSCFRHFIDWWKFHRGLWIEYGIEETLCAVMFNVMGYLHEHLKERSYGQQAGDKPEAVDRKEAAAGDLQGKDGQPLPGRDSGLVVLGQESGHVDRVEVGVRVTEARLDHDRPGYIWLTGHMAKG